ncbi:hypothetical protein PMI29_02795 [Pseudomonas sp. GM49]|nr:hypothetical protein PMI29_02795 [Pseudomonas sp. GM49]
MKTRYLLPGHMFLLESETGFVAERKAAPPPVSKSLPAPPA